MSRTLADAIVEALTTRADSTPVCLVHENLQSCKLTKRGTSITLGVPKHLFTPDDAIWFTGQLGRPDTRKPKYVGVIVFVPTDVYEGK
jgi:hypothetical protein